jgi:hypothetical protein
MGNRKLQLPTRRVAMVVLLIIAVPAFAFFVPVMHLPYSDHTVCPNFGAYCRLVAQYGDLSYFYLCTGAIYQTDGSYWIDTCIYA